MNNVKNFFLNGDVFGIIVTNHWHLGTVYTIHEIMSPVDFYCSKFVSDWGLCPQIHTSIALETTLENLHGYVTLTALQILSRKLNTEINLIVILLANHLMYMYFKTHSLVRSTHECFIIKVISLKSIYQTVTWK